MNPKSTLYQIPSLIHHISPSHFPRSVQIQSTTPESIQIQCYRSESVISSTTILIIDASEIPFPESPHSGRPCRARARAFTKITTFCGSVDQDRNIFRLWRPGSRHFLAPSTRFGPFPRRPSRGRVLPPKIGPRRRPVRRVRRPEQHCAAWSGGCSAREGQRGDERRRRGGCEL